ncbi:VWA domain-containing protein [Auraticoccus sp. F435]|uniref:VWA domain-containing protein n=1 Tax=Auraticoccus cholistanensis TaxID=2656650 RepID=A0A6A9UP84_9ACTN|nr:VWA domain-containing protein [Auraticoccus cholistanensis]MVA74481.1 VWA domain-containing protein [Auraticoccus cholistanensis]
MTDPTFTHLAMLLDRSGSMQAIKTATERGFDAFVAEQRAQPGLCTMTLAQFDYEYQEVFRDLDIADVPPLELAPRGSTALLDAIARLVHTTGERLAALPEHARPGNVVVGIMTDGHENSSREYTHPAIKALISQQEEVYDWTFLYMGANQDAIEVGEELGVDPRRSMTYTAAGTGAALGATAAMVSRMREARAGGLPARQVREDTGYTQSDRDQAGR